MDKQTDRETERQAGSRFRFNWSRVGIVGIGCGCVCVSEWTAEQANTQGSAERVCRPRKLVASVPTSLQLAAWLRGCLVAPCHAGLHSVHSSLSTIVSSGAAQRPRDLHLARRPSCNGNNSTSCSSCMGKSKRKFLLPNLLHATTPV